MIIKNHIINNILKFKGYVIILIFRLFHFIYEHYNFTKMRKVLENIFKKKIKYYVLKKKKSEKLKLNNKYKFLLLLKLMPNSP